MRKLSPDRQDKLDRIHLRDCPARRCLDLGPCMQCMDIEARRKSAEMIASQPFWERGG